MLLYETTLIKPADNDELHIRYARLQLCSPQVFYWHSGGDVHRTFLGMFENRSARRESCIRKTTAAGRSLYRFGLQFYNYLDERGHPVMARAHNALDEVDSIPIESSCKYGWTNCANHRSEF